jgi:hypothetical protein
MRRYVTPNGPVRDKGTKDERKGKERKGKGTRDVQYSLVENQQRVGQSMRNMRACM